VIYCGVDKLETPRNEIFSVFQSRHGRKLSAWPSQVQIFP
jgi:hypothetical protein